MSEIINAVNLDSGQTAFFARELDFVKAKTYKKEYADLKAISLIPVSMEAGSGAQSITYQQFDQIGMAKIIADYANDLPRADMVGAEFTARVRSIGSSYGYSVQDIRAAEFTGRSLEARKAEAARRAVDQEINRIAWFGDATHGLQGLLTHPNVTRVAVAQNQGSTSTLWKDKTSAEILEDMNDLVHGIIDLTKGIEMPDTLLLPIKQWTRIATTRMDSGTDSTILEFFLKNSPAITEVHWINEATAAGVGVGGVSAGADIMVAYQRNPDKLTLEIPQPFEQFQAQERGLEFVVATHARCAGVVLYAPLSVAIAEGI